MKSILRQAIFENRLSDIPEILKKNPHLLNQKDDDGYTPLSDALFYNRIEILELLHDAGVDYTINWDNKHPLYWALLYSNANIQCFLFSAANLKPDNDCLRILTQLQDGKHLSQIIIEELS